MSSEFGSTQESGAAPGGSWASKPTGSAAGGIDVSAGQALGGDAGRTAADGARGPFAPPVTSLLRNCFGHMLDDITVARDEGGKNRGIGAAAHTIGRHISLGDNIKEDPADPHSMEVITHEVAHALGAPGQRQHVLDRAGDPGEHAAYDAGRSLRSFIQGGGKGPAPQLKPAHGGRAGVHRFEAGEHADAVDNAASLLKDAETQGRKGAVTVDPKVAAQMNKKIKLDNGLEVTPGEITAMMGDFYGAFDKDGKFNASKSFDALNSADPKEMREILKAVNAEKESVAKVKSGQESEFHETDPGQLENLTKWREQKVDAGGTTTGFSMLELASKNDSHFNKKDESGTDNNMGAYTTFHKMALEAAAKGDKNKALALEASAQHFMTDRFAGGHQFDKDALMKASGKPGLLAQGVARIEHNKYNEQGVQVGNEQGESWNALGDAHWADKGNEQNRFQAAKAVYASYAELNSALDGKLSPDKIKDLSSSDLAAHKTVPKFDEQFQKKVEKEGADLSYPDLIKEVGPDALNAAGPTIQRTLINSGATGRNLVKSWEENADSLNPMKAWNWLKGTAGEAWDGVKKTGSGALDWMKNTGGEALDGVKDATGGAWNWLKNTGQSALGGIKDAAGGAWDWAKNTGGEARDSAKDAAGGAWNWMKDTAGGAWDAVKHGPGALWDYGKDKGSEAWGGIKNAAGGAVDWAKEKGGEAWGGVKNAAGGAVDWAKEKGGEAWGGIKNAAGGAVDWAKEKGGEAWGGVKNAASGAVDWAKEKGGEAWGGLKNGYSAAKDLGGAAWDFTKDMGGRAADWGKEKVHNGVDWGKRKANQAWEGVQDFGHEVAETASETWSGAKQSVGSGITAVKDTAKGAWNGTKDAASSSWGWLKKQAGY